MKFVLSFMLAMSMFMLMSCGDKNASTKLSVSFGFSGGVLATNYPGGIVFFGRSSNNKMFSAPLDQNNQVEIDLEKGVWTLGAVGWKGANKLTGETECVLKEVLIDTDNKSVSLDLKSENCNSGFGANWDNSNIKFKGLGIITCGTFYKDSSHNILNSDDPNYCNSTSTIEADFRTQAKSAVIEIPSIPNGVSNLTTDCIPLTEGKINESSYSIATKALPVRIKLSDTSCGESAKLMSTYEFKDGIDFNYSSEFDHKYFFTSANGNLTSHLYLLATDSKRGQTFFINSIPKLKCDMSIGSSCHTIPGMVSGIERVVEADEEFYVRDANAVDCSGATFTINSINQEDLTSTNCRSKNGKIFVRLQENQISNCTATTCSISLTFSDNSMTTLSFIKASLPEISALNLLYRTVGHEDVTSAASGKFSLKTLFEDHFNSGALSDIRKVMGPGLIGGMLFPISNLIDNVTLDLKKWEEGEQKNYLIKSVALTNELIPSFVATNNDPGQISTSEKFDYKITISEIRPAPLLPQPFIVFKFKKDKQVGSIEQFHHHLEENTRWITDRYLTYWNTQDDNSNRTESYTYRQETDLDANVLSKDVSFSRAERDNVNAQFISGSFSSGSGLRVEDYQFSSHQDCSAGTPCTYKENGSKQLLLLNGKKMKFSNEVFNISDTTQLGFFSDPYISDFKRSPDISGIDSASAKSPNGEYLVRAWNEKDVTSSTYNLKILVKKRGLIKRETTLNVQSNGVIKPQLIIGNDGYPMISFATGGYIYALVGIGFQITTSTPYWVVTNNQIFNPTAPIATNSITDGTLLNEDPTSTTCSNKTILYGTSYGIRSLTFNCANTNTPSWGMLVPLANETNSHSNIQVLKHGNYYYISYQLSNLVKVFRTTTLQPPAGSLPTPFTGPTFSSGSSIKMIVNGTSVDLVEILETGELNLSPSINSAINGVTATTPVPSFGLFVPIEDAPKTLKKSEFCLERRIGSANPINLNPPTPSSCDGFSLPNTSHADPIKLKFKYDIDSLNPSEFNTIFTIPNLN